MVEKTCPYGIEHCATFSRQDPRGFQESSNSSNNITKIFTKDCAPYMDCSKLSSRCNGQSNGAEMCSHECCHGDLCNMGMSYKANSNGSVALLLAAVLAIQFAFRESIC